MGVIGTQAVSGVKSTTNFFTTPWGKWNLIIASVFLFVFLFIGISHSIETKSLYPLWHESGERILSADSHLGQQVDKLVDGSAPVKPAGFFYQGTAKYVWFWVGWWFTTIGCFFMIYFFVWLLYGFWTLMNSDSVIRNVLLTGVTYLVIGLISGMILFVMGLAGKTLPDDRSLIFDKTLENSYPFHGTVKFVSYFVNSRVIESAYSWAQTPIGGAVTGFESDKSLNQSMNASGV